jgi:hypothetical protein
LINVFTVKPAYQRQLLELLRRATETSVRHAPGFISASRRSPSQSSIQESMKSSKPTPELR